MIEFRNINKVCLFLPHGIGDVISATPLISALREYKPALYLTVVVKNNVIAQLFGDKTRVDEIVEFDMYKKNGVKEIIDLILNLRKRHCDLFITDYPGKFIPLFAFLVGAKIRMGETKGVFDFLYRYSFITNFNEHRVVHNWKILETIGINIKNSPSVYFSNDDKNFVEQNILSEIQNDNFLVVHAGCGLWGTHKRWDKNNFAELIKLIVQNFSINVFLVGDSDEVELCNDIALKVNNANVISIAGKLSIRQLAAFLSEAQLVIGNDSGVMHLASACNIKNITLFGPTIYKWTAPFTNNIVITKNLPCSPCHLKMPYGCGNPICMNLIEVNEVYDVVKKELNKELMKFFK